MGGQRKEEEEEMGDHCLHIKMGSVFLTSLDLSFWTCGPLSFNCRRGSTSDASPCIRACVTTLMGKGSQR